MSEDQGISAVTWWQVGNRLPNGKWPATRITRTVLSEHDTVSEAAGACIEANARGDR